MGQLVFGLVLLGVAFFLRLAAAAVRTEGARPVGGALRIASLASLVVGILVVLGSALVVINAGEVGVQHAFGRVTPTPLLSGIRMVAPWSSIERYSTREEQYPFSGDQIEEIAALSSEQMGMTVDVSLRWQIDPQQAAHIYTEIGNEDQIHSAVRNAIRKGVRDGMVQYSINDISKRTQIATTMEALVDSALVTQPRVGGPRFRIATVTAFFLRDLQPPAQVVQAINNKIAQEQQVETERHRVEVARLQAEQQRLLNTTLTAEALTRQYFDVLRELKSSNNLVILVPTEGGIPVLNLGELRQNLRRP
ncbi:MAG TPA: SPFH domain-containing protein [Gemmatimonadales bacterium]|jgi:regulator of protease activity HflC (stomatin/prohibitin superfamily)|nr:SPFH domain-containing protein [Gemmatimonadales bacterium]